MFHIEKRFGGERIAINRLNTLQTLEKGLQVLTCFTPATPEWGVTALAVHLRMPKSAVHKTLSSFQRWGMVVQDPETKRYRLGLRVLQLAEAVSESRELRKAAGPQMDHLSAQTRETVVLRIVDGDDTVWLDVRESPEQMRMTARVGRRTPLYAGASNLVLTAYLPAERVEQVIKRLAPVDHPARIDFRAFLQLLAAIREAGYAVTTGEVEPGVTAVAAPVRDWSGRVVAGLSVSGPAYRITEDQIPTLIRLVSEAAADISRRLGAPT